MKKVSSRKITSTSGMSMKRMPFLRGRRSWNAATGSAPQRHGLRRLCVVRRVGARLVGEVEPGAIDDGEYGAVHRRALAVDTALDPAGEEVERDGDDEPDRRRRQGDPDAAGELGRIDRAAAVRHLV